MQLAQLIQDLPGILKVEGATALDITGIAYDSRQVEHDNLFCALRGFNVDGHQYIEQAISRGATAILCDRAEECQHEGVTRIICEDSRAILPNISARFYASPSKDLLVIGITGTNGKTTTAYYLQHLLNACGLPCGRIGTTGVAYGDFAESTLHTTPEAPDLQAFMHSMVSAGMQAVVMEVSSHALDQCRADAIDYDAALFTNLTQDHLDYHRNMDHYFNSKLKLFRMLDSGKLAVYNADDPRGIEIRSGTAARCISLGTSRGADYELVAVSVTGKLARLSIQAPQGPIDLEVNTIGAFNYLNALAAFSLALELGMQSELVVPAMTELPAVPGRLENVSGDLAYQIFIDYAHTPDAVQRVLEVLREAYPQQRLICVFGCGGDRDIEKRPRMGKLATELADKTFITDDNPRSESSAQIFEHILAGVSADSDFVVIQDRTAAIHAALDTAEDGDVVAILGKGHEDYQEIQGKRIPYSDLHVIQNYRVYHGN